MSRRALAYWVVGLGLTLGYSVTRGSTWVGSVQLHTLMEGLATLLALMAGTIALVRFYSRKDNTFLFLGTGFVGTAILDGYHTVVTSMFFKPYMPSDLPSLIPWSWIASRQFLSVLMFLSWLAWLREERLGEAGRIGEWSVYLFSILFTLASFLFFAYGPLPRAYYPEFFFNRPEEFLPGLFFLLALVGYIHKGRWRDDSFEHWLVLSLIVGFIGQIVFMSFSGRLFDFEFDAAHTLKKMSYICVLIGLLSSMYSIFRKAENSSLKQLEKSEAQFRGAIASLQEGFALFDSEDRLVIYNEEYLRLNSSIQDIIKPGMRFEDLVRTNAKHGIIFEAIGREEEHIQERIEQHRNPAHPIISKLTDGTWHIVNESRTPDGGIAVTQTDITELKKVEEKLQALTESLRHRTLELETVNQDLETFCYSVSHDLRGPLRAIDGFSQALLEDYGDVLDDTARKYLQRVRKGCERMTQLIEDLLILSRVNRGELQRQKVNLTELVESIAAELRRTDTERKVTFDIAQDLSIEGDVRMIRIVLENLLGNAWKFTGKCEQAKIEFGVTNHNGEPAYFVRDDGVGFDMAYADNLFKPFQRLYGTNEFEGTGIGLATVNRAIQRHGGRVWAEGTVGQGATVYFTL